MTAQDQEFAPPLERRQDLPPVFDGGTEEDRQAVLALHHGFLAANDPLDKNMIRQVFDPSPSNLFFNTNGYTYTGLDEWCAVWDFYRPRRVVLQPYTTGDVRITIRGDMAYITAEWIARYKQRTARFSDTLDYRYYRATEVCIKKDGVWKTVHAHFSAQREGLRPELRPLNGETS